ncbi:MAG: protein kinase [Verrucomicrobiaceae bacterium]|nr:protein kinase [Verrucomicrobiaceae bacterium]
MQGLLAAAAGGVTRELRAWQPPGVADLQKLLPQYEITAFIARGGMGAVYKGVQRSLERTVAIKILPPDITDDGEANYAQRFKQEARAMAKFKHPGIVTVYEAGEVDSSPPAPREEHSVSAGGERPQDSSVEAVAAAPGSSRGSERAAVPLLYFVMEFIEGTDVAQLVAAQGQLPPQEAIRITTAVCDALAYAHSRGVVHRDIKPSNVMIDADGQVKVADFGLAKMTAQDSGGLTKSSVAMGTPDFIAPEVMIAGTLVDQRADIYAVGVMLYQMLTGHIPRGRFSPISAVLPQSDPKLDAIVDKAMQTDREKRYSSAVEMKTEVESVCRASVPDATAGKPSHRDGLQSRHRAPLLLGAAVLVIGGGAYVFMQQRSSPKPDAALSSSPSLPVTKPSPSTAWLPDGPPGLVKELEAEGMVRGLTMMPDGRRVMSKSDVPQGTSATMQIIQWDVETGKRLWVREFPTGHSLDNPMILLNGDASMAMLQRTPELSLIFLDSKNGSTQRRLPIQGTPLAAKNVAVRSQIGASPDGKRLAVAMFKASTSDFEPVCLQVFDAATHAPAGLWTLGSQVQSIYSLDWLDDDRVIVALNEVDKALPDADRRLVIVNVSHPENEAQAVKPTQEHFDHYLAAIPGMRNHIITHSEGTVALCDVGQGRVTRRWPGTNTQRFFAFPNERTVLGLAENPTRSNPVTLWELPTGREIGTLSDPRIHDILALSPDGSYVVTNELEPGSGSARRLSSGKIGVWRLPKLPANVMPDQKKSAAAPSWPHLPTQAEKKPPFTNSLGMKFMPVPGTDVLFCIHETRKKDYAAYAAETPGVDMTWKQPSIYHDLPVGAGEDHPVTQINLADCQGFCAWLSAREGRRYRLPTDLEWSWAVGIGDREDASALPEKRGGGAGSVYAWGTEWPPPPRVANIADESLRQVAAHVPNRLIPGYEDGFATTAPVMSFPPNALGIYDLAGNVWELIPDWMDAEKQDVLRRGSSFNNGSLDPARAYVAASVRNRRNPHARSEDGGFRVVVEKP